MARTLSIPGLDEIVGPMPMEFGEWAKWRARVLAWRNHIWALARYDLETRKRELDRCAASRDYFVSVYGWIFEPRADPQENERPYILYPRQVELGQTLDWCLTQTGPNADLLVSKARDVGASWYMIADDLWRWRFLPNYQGRLVSRNEDLVDQLNNADSLFWKLEFILKHLPEWLLPEGFVFKKHRLKLRLINPANGSAIVGESTSSQAGRGGRAFTRKYDEGAFIRGFEGIWDAAANATNHRIVISSESLEEDDGFFNIRTGRNNRVPPCIFEFNWDQVPGHDLAYFQDMQRRLAPDAFQREILRNAEAGLGAWIYPEARDKSVGHFPYVPEWPVYVAMDDGFDDDTVLHFIQYGEGRYRVVRSYVNSHLPIDFYGSIIKGAPEERFMRYYTGDDFDLMAWTAELWPENEPSKIKGFYGDHHGHHTDLTSGSSPYSRLSANYGITFISARDKISFDHRQSATHLILPLTDFHDHPSVARTLLAFQEYRRPKRRTGEAVAEAKGGVHNWASHPVTAFEYAALQFVMNTQVPLVARRAKLANVAYPYRNNFGAQFYG